MNHDSRTTSNEEAVEMPRPTAAPLVVAAGIVLVAMGVATSLAFVPVGILVFIFGLGRWINQLLPNRGHIHDPKVEPEFRAKTAKAVPGGVQQLQRGMPGYRLRLPAKVHPVSAGVKGGIVGGLVMPLPALAYGYFSGHGIWWPVNLLAGMVLPGVDDMPAAELEQFHSLLLVIGIAIHAVVSLITGLMYGVLMPTLPNIRKPLAWGALLMPLLWSAASFVALGQMNPEIRESIEWPWFILSQFVFGVVAASVFMHFESQNRVLAGLYGGVAGGLLMPITAILWSVVAGHGIWYPINLLAAMVLHHAEVPTLAALERFHDDWLLAALMIHATFSLLFGLAFAIGLPRLPPIPAPIVWGGLLLPLLWTAMSYGLMGVVNPVLQEHVDWPWFIVSQFVFGVSAAIVVVRSEQVYIPPAGRGLESREDFVAN